MISKQHRARVVEIWKDTLGLESIDFDRAFAEAGGTSLLANEFVDRLSRELGIVLPVIQIFEYPTLRLLLRMLEGGAPPPREKVAPINHLRQAAPADPQPGDHDVAIVGMACRFPGAKNLEEYWANLLDGRDSITQLTEEQLSPGVSASLRSDPRYVRAAGLIDEPYGMDAGFFSVTPTEAKLMDPQQRVLLEVSWHALEHAGEARGARFGRAAVYMGVNDNTYYKREIAPFPDAEQRAGHFLVMTGSEKDFVALRIAHKLDLKGPAISVHTACSTSLVAVIMACRSLRAGDCDMALAGGASVHFPTPEGYYFQEGGVASPDGRCRPFDSKAQGTVFTDGAGVVVLKRLADAQRDGNTIYAVIKGGAINSDGADKASFSAPSIRGQADCIRMALSDANVDAGTIQYLEAHGTATPIGDPAEIEGLRQAYAGRSDAGRQQYCGLGSVKGNIGHTTAAAGVASLIKTTLAVHRQVIPASLHFSKPNPQLNLDKSPFFVVDAKRDWPKGAVLRRAGISSFGIGGTNAHLILEEAPERHVADAIGHGRPFEIWPVSAKTVPQRDRLIEGLNAEKAWPRDVARSLQEGRARLGIRGASVRVGAPMSREILIQPAQGALDDPRVAFLFPGQGSQYIGMGKSLHDLIPEFRTTFSQCCDVLSAEMGLDFKAFIFDTQNQELLENTRYTQPALFAVEVSLGQMFLDWGIQPTVMVGHSIGEFVAAHLAGVFSLEDALKLVAARGRLMADLPRGRMLSARGAMDEVLAAAGEPVDVASINGPVQCVLAGPDVQMDRVKGRLESAGIPCRPLHTSHAFHSAMMDPVVEPFLDIVRSVTLHAPKRPLISSVSGEAMSAGTATDPRYWANHLRATVKFSSALFRALDGEASVFLEVGPRTTLSSLAAQHFQARSGAAAHCLAIPVLADNPDPVSEIGALGSALARLWCAGFDIDWRRIWADGQNIPLSSLYPFERRNYRFSEGQVTSTRFSDSQLMSLRVEVPALIQPDAGKRSPAAQATVELMALCSEYAGFAIDRPAATFVECGLDSLVLMQIGAELGKRYGVSISLRDLMEKHNSPELLGAHMSLHTLPELWTHSSAPPPLPPQAVRVESPPVVMEKPRSESATSVTGTHERPRLVGGTGSFRRPLFRARRQQPLEDGAFRVLGIGSDEAWYVFNEHSQQYEQLN